MTTRVKRHAEQLLQAFIESKAAQSQLSTASSLPLVVVTVSGPTSQHPPQEPSLVLMVEEEPHETPFVADAQAVSVPTDK